MYNNISSSMTDRCPTNGAVLRKLEARLDKSIVMLNCAVHPLDRMCHAMRKMLVQHDNSNKIKRMSKSTDCCVINLLIAVSKMMYSGKGDHTT